jgi:hypothetical protein
MRQAITTAWGSSHVILKQGRTSVSETIDVRSIQNEWKRAAPFVWAQRAAKAGDPCRTGGGDDSKRDSYRMSLAV